MAASLTGGNALAAFVSTIRVLLTNIKHENHPDNTWKLYIPLCFDRFRSHCNQKINRVGVGLSRDIFSRGAHLKQSPWIVWKWLSTYYLFLKGLVLWARSPCWEGEGVGLSSSKVFLLDTVGTVFFGLQSNARFLDLFYLHGTSSFRSTDPISSLLDIYCVFLLLAKTKHKAFNC